MACIFCRIVDRSAPAEMVYEDDELIVFKDIHPRAPIHVLLVPREHIATVNDLDGPATSPSWANFSLWPKPWRCNGGLPPPAIACQCMSDGVGDSSSTMCTCIY